VSVAHGYSATVQTDARRSAQICHK
jgi:hypothetical protein